ncbi:hypothetical protein IL38_24315, partial [Actinopolyspora erythraea]
MWWEQELEHALAITDPSERRNVLRELRQKRDHLRAEGQLWDTASAVITYYLTLELDDRGWLHRRWRAVPAHEAEMPGRRWGVTSSGWQARLRVHLPDDLGDRLRRATYWTSLPATRRLQELTTQWP